MASCSSAYGRRTCWPRRTWRAERRPSVAMVLDVLLLITGASGAGKSSVRRAIARELCPVVECVELRDVVAVPVAPALPGGERAAQGGGGGGARPPGGGGGRPAPRGPR